MLFMITKCSSIAMMLVFILVTRLIMLAHNIQHARILVIPFRGPVMFRALQIAEVPETSRDNPVQDFCRAPLRLGGVVSKI
jgi:hypothetical protein